MLKLMVFVLFFLGVSAEVSSFCELNECECSGVEIICKNLIGGEFNVGAIPSGYKSLAFFNSKFKPYSEYKPVTSPNDIVRLEFYRCTLQDIDPFDLSNFQKLQVLNFTQTQLDLSHINLTGTDIVNLEITECGIKSENKSMLIKLFEQTPKLDSLALVGNNFHKITDDMFAPISNLQSLELDRCSINQISPLSVFHNLRNFDLTDNKLTSLPPNLLLNTAHLVDNFEVGGNNLSTIPIDFSHYKSLKLVEFEGMQLVCECEWLTTINTSLIQPTDLMCYEQVNDTKRLSNLTLSAFQTQCHILAAHNVDERAGHGMAVVLGILLAILILVVLAFFGHKFWQSHKRTSREKQQVKYSAVYKETVEPNPPTSRTTIETKA